MKYFKYVSFVAIASFLFASCSSDDDNINPQEPLPTGDYVDGFFIVNEGPFGGSGSLSFVKNDFSEVTQNVFSVENPNADIGSFVQSVFFDEERMFIISNGSNLINVVNRFTLEFIEVIDAGFEVPRYGVVLDNKAYVTNLAGFDSTIDDFIVVVNLETYEVESNIAVNNIADKIEAYNGKLVVQNSAFSDGNSVSLINPATAAIEQVVQVGDGLNSMVLANNQLFTLSGNQLSKVDLGSFNVTETITIPEEAEGVNNLRIDQNQVYYTLGNSVYSNSVNELDFTEEQMFSYETNSESGVFYGFAVKDNQIYISDAGDFASNGNIHVYSETGEILLETEVGLGPNGFYFN
ncbi:YncE family protein [Psychroflexus planctonicus]|uniref:40-residue YVTN family beta-propeller repeat-containing protein n=1 Tax=Psychroflexus planctonicus TaxID=1526575 RepID=A0ABQ1SCL7_9FLAO|nr:DUF5074 domain-containing protein [Psychroflexus planctonicus]GGE28359.1 hypothetical protein GCM10010832_06290 [Psychroflexus planctonicus]